MSKIQSAGIIAADGQRVVLKLSLIGFVFSRSGKSQISIILLFIEGYVHFVSSEIGFVLHINTCLGGSEAVGLKLGLFPGVLPTSQDKLRSSMCLYWVCFSGVQRRGLCS